MNGSEIVSLAGRTMVLGDSFSRNPEHRDALLSALEARTGDLRRMQEVLKGFDIDELRTTEPWDGGFKPPPHKEVTKNWPGVVTQEELATSSTAAAPPSSPKILGISRADELKKPLVLLGPLYEPSPCHLPHRRPE